MRIATALTRQASLVLVMLLIASVVPVAAIGVPANAAIAAKQAEAAAAAARLADMNAAFEVSVEEYNAITEALDKTRLEIAATRAELDEARAALTEAQGTLSARAASIYKDSGSSMLDVVLGARSFQDFIVRLDLAVRINRSDAAAVSTVKDAKARVESAEAALKEREAEQLALQAEARARAAAIEAQVAVQERFVASLNSEVQALVAAEEARLAAEAAERARQAAKASQSVGRTGVARQAADPGSLGSPHPEALDIGLRYLGVPYVWGGSTPAGFDCSGLTSYVYDELAIDIPRTSQSQYRVGQHIAPDRLDLLQPGDLVFFGTDGDPERVHHVGIYAGGGNYLHAPYTGAVVRVDSLRERISSRADYVGASRL